MIQDSCGHRSSSMRACGSRLDPPVDVCARRRRCLALKLSVPGAWCACPAQSCPVLAHRRQRSSALLAACAARRHPRPHLCALLGHARRAPEPIAPGPSSLLLAPERAQDSGQEHPYVQSHHSRSPPLVVGTRSARVCSLRVDGLRVWPSGPKHSRCDMDSESPSVPASLERLRLSWLSWPSWPSHHQGPPGILCSYGPAVLLGSYRRVLIGLISLSLLSPYCRLVVVSPFNSLPRLAPAACLRVIRFLDSLIPGLDLFSQRENPPSPVPPRPRGPRPRTASGLAPPARQPDDPTARPLAARANRPPDRPRTAARVSSALDLSFLRSLRSYPVCPV